MNTITQAENVIVIAPLLLSREQAAAALGGISVSHLDRLEKRGAIGPHQVKLGNCCFYRADDLATWVRGGLPSRVEWDGGQSGCLQGKDQGLNADKHLRQTA